MDAEKVKKLSISFCEDIRMFQNGNDLNKKPKFLYYENLLRCSQRSDMPVHCLP